MIILRTFIFVLYFILYLIYSIPYLLVVKKLNNQNKILERDRIINNMAYSWSKSLIKLTGTKVTVYGHNNVPLNTPVVFISNHQGYFDIPLLLSYVDRTKGFIAKRELSKVPILKDWMIFLNCVFIDRGNPRKSLRAINQGIKNLQKGYSMVIFPEGTRSRGKTLLNKFKPGSLRLATKAGVPIIPITIKGSYKIFEENRYFIKPAHVEIYISEPIFPEEYKEMDSNTLNEYITDIMVNNLSN